jgi:carbonic anhydrase/acetyltransferase-like protein (isoleucine patch superfamily)
MENTPLMHFIGTWIRAKNCVVTGECTIGRDSSVWFGAIIRGDVARIEIGERCNLQDNAVIHCDSGIPNHIESDVTIGHGAIVHGEHVGSGSLIGMHATVLGKTRIGQQCLIAAGAVVPPGMQVPDRSMVMGVPGKIVRPVTDKELEYMSWLSGHYVALAKRYANGEIGEVRE